MSFERPQSQNVNSASTQIEQIVKTWQEQEHFFNIQFTLARSISDLYIIAKKYSEWFLQEEQKTYSNDFTKETTDQLSNNLLALHARVKSELTKRVNAVIEERNQVVEKKYQEWEYRDREFSNLAELNEINQVLTDIVLSESPTNSFREALEKLKRATSSVYLYINLNEADQLEDENGVMLGEIGKLKEILDFKNENFLKFSTIKSLPGKYVPAYKAKIMEIIKNFITKVDHEIQKINNAWIERIKPLAGLLETNPTQKTEIIAAIQKLQELKQQLGSGSYQKERGQIEIYKNTFLADYLKKCFSSKQKNLEDRIREDFSIIEEFNFSEKITEIDTKIIELKKKLKSILVTTNKALNQLLVTWKKTLSDLLTTHAENPSAVEMTIALKNLSLKITGQYLPNNFNVLNTEEEVEFDGLCKRIEGMRQSIETAIDAMRSIRVEHEDWVSDGINLQTELDNLKPEQLNIKADALLNLKERYEQRRNAGGKLYSSLVTHFGDLAKSNGIEVTNISIGKKLKEEIEHDLIRLDNFFAANDAVNSVTDFCNKRAAYILEQIQIKEQQIAAYRAIAIQAAKEMKEEIKLLCKPGDVHLDSDRMEAIIQKIVQDRQHIKEAEISLIQEMKNLEQEKESFFQKYQSSLESIKQNPHLTTQYNAAADKFENAKDELSNTVRKLNEAHSHNDSIIGCYTHLYAAGKAYESINQDINTLKTQLNGLQVEQNTQDLVNKIIELRTIDADLTEQLYKEVQIKQDEDQDEDKRMSAKLRLDQLINDKLENNQLIAATLEQLKAHSPSIIKKAAEAIKSLGEINNKFKLLKEDLRDLIQETYSNIDKALAANTEFNADLKSARMHFINSLVAKYPEPLAQLPRQHKQSIEYCTNLDNMIAEVEIENVSLLNMLKMTALADEIGSWDAPIIEYLKSTKDQSIPPCIRLANINKGIIQIAEELENKKKALQDKIAREHITFSNLIEDLESRFNEFSGSDQHELLKRSSEQYTNLSASLNDRVESQKTKLANRLNDVKQELNKTYQAREIQKFVNKDFAEVNYKLFIYLQDHVLNCRFMTELLKHNRKEGSLKIDLVNTYEKQIKDAANLSELLAAVIDNPKDPAGRLDANGNILSLRGNTGHSSFFAKSTSNNLMKYIYEELEYQIKFHYDNLRALEANPNPRKGSNRQ